MSFQRAAFGLLFLAAAFPGAGCGSSVGDETAGHPCGSDADCGSGERCDLSLEMHPRIMAMCSYAPCGLNNECPEGLACIPPPPGSQTPGWGGCAPLVCAPPCTSTSCPSGQVCRESGICAIPQCDEPGIEACPEHWRCDPATATTEPQGDYGSVIEDTLEARNSIVRGCVRMRCDETDGHVCKEFWRCAPSETAGGSGCLPIPCAESGHCENDDYICEPTSTAQRSPGMDFYGCALKNCEEGRECIAPSISDPSVAYCDPSAPNADNDGCALRTCDEGNTCVDTYLCAPESPDADRIGCIPAPGNEGSGGSIGTSGTGGTSGSGGGAGASSGGSGGVGGSVDAGGSGASGAGTGGSMPATEGHCVAS